MDDIEEQDLGPALFLDMAQVAMPATGVAKGVGLFLQSFLTVFKVVKLRL
jgi:hypothetical protein